MGIGLLWVKVFACGRDIQVGGDREGDKMKVIGEVQGGY